MSRVRDEAIDDWDMIVGGRMKDKESQEIANGLRNCSPEQLALLKELIPAIVDTTLHHLMWTVEQREDVSLRMAGGPELRTISDGLPGDLGIWKERYSKQRSYGKPHKPS